MTIDAEDWFHVCGDDYYSDPRRWNSFVPRIERTLSAIFDRLARGGNRATVFFLGWIAGRYPDLVREAARRGHEIGIHGDLHRRADELTASELREDLLRCRDRIEKAAGVRPTAHRAAEWSVRHPADPTLRALPPLGFRCDASMTAVAPLGRVSNPPGPHRLDFQGESLIEIPPLTGRGFGRRLLLGGGWAFRMFSPERLARAEEEFRQRGHPAVFTFHPWEFDDEHPSMDGLSPLLRLVHFFRLGALPERFERWLARDRSEALEDVLPRLSAA